MTREDFLWSLVALLSLAIISLVPIKAHAQDGYGSYHWDWDLGSGDPHKRWHRTYRRHYEGQVHYYRDPDDTARYYELEAHHEERHCLDHVETAVSTEHTGPEEAMVSATKLWAARVSFLWGGRFMNWENAEQKRVLCDQSNAMDTLTGRIIDNVQKLAGNEGKNQRCFIAAIPCSGPMERAEEKR